MKKQLLALALLPALIFGAAAIPMPQQASAATAQIVSSVSMRQSADENSTRIRYLKQGEQVTILSKVNSWWYKVKASDGREGYISTSSKYIQTSGGSSSGGDTNGGTESGSTSAKVQKIIAAGKKYLGTPYEYGSSRNNTATFDCSDFVRQAFLDGIGVTLPSDSRGQGSYVKSLGHAQTDWHDLKAGDLMFFMDYKGTSKSNYNGINKSTQKITHVAIYLGNGQILSTYSKESGGVRIDSIANKHWEYRFLFGGSAL
ncbi:hypothetical protein GCM10008018_35170 [Paenibacillus marchantiophytorum]|uniref:Hydrolase Nlp/P60 n=1 Tax=Paenibacillus marchantiophytorum TaxID=1619310 RepID=A0ABQ1ET09_9BACL|nr:SH3 domain-containing C40 family peptidase [Paenibacillus marchantiophytorum]GFZ86053.1 hypothetical protein GCM10008018_35170 [Paenibacillus marchantiophytorum]